MSLQKVEDLLEQLSASEKRHAAAMAKRLLSGSESRMIQLLKHIETYKGKKDNGELQEILAREFDAASLPADLNYLYRFLLKALRAYHEETTVDLRIRTWLTNFQLLLSKRLYDLAYKELERAKKLAQHHERYTDLLYICQLEANILIEHGLKDMFDKLEAITTQAQHALEALTTTNRFYFLERKAFAYVRTRYHMRTEEGTQLLNEIQKNEMLAQPPPNSLQTARLRYLNIQSAIAICNGDFKSASAVYDRMLEIWESDRVRLKEDAIEYKKLLSNKLTALHASSDFGAMPELIRKIQSMPCSSAEEEAEQFQNVYFMELLLRMNTDQLDDFDPFVRKIQEGLEKYRSKINHARYLLFLYNISVAYFSLHRWKEACDWTSRIIDQPKSDHRKDVQYFARLFRLVLLYELNKHDLLDYELLNTERYLRQHKAWFAYEASVLKFLRKLLTADTSLRSRLFDEFHKSLVDISEGRNSATLPGITELQLWTRSKTGKTSIRELIRS